MNGNLSKRKGLLSEITNKQLSQIVDSLNEKALGSLSSKEDISNKTKVLSEIECDDYENKYPTAGAVLDYVLEKANALQADINYLTIGLLPSLERNENKTTEISSASTDVQYPSAAAVYTALSQKVDKESGKGLSSNDYTSADRTEVAKIKDKADKTEIPVKTSDLENDSEFCTTEELSTKEDVANKVTEITEDSADTAYPSAKAVFDLTKALEDMLSDNLKKVTPTICEDIDNVPYDTGWYISPDKSACVFSYNLKTYQKPSISVQSIEAQSTTNTSQNEPIILKDEVWQIKFTSKGEIRHRYRDLQTMSGSDDRWRDCRFSPWTVVDEKGNALSAQTIDERENPSCNLMYGENGVGLLITLAPSPGIVGERKTYLRIDETGIAVGKYGKIDLGGIYTDGYNWNYISYTKEETDEKLSAKEDVANKVTEFLPHTITDTQYPSAKAVWDLYSPFLEESPNYESTQNKVTTITDVSTDSQYPSAKAVYLYTIDTAISLSEHINTKEDAFERELLTQASCDVALSNKKDVRCFTTATDITLTTPTVSVITSEEEWECYLSFKSGATPTSLAYSATPIKWVGVDCDADGDFVPSANTNYEISFRVVNIDDSGNPVIVARVGVY